MADNPTFTNQAQTFSTNANPDIPVRGDADVNGKIRQVVRLDVATGTSESLISAANPLPITGAITGPLTPAPSSTGNHMAVSGPVGAMYYTSLTIAASPASTDQILQFSSVTTTGAGGTYRGDLIGIMASGAGSQYSSVAIVGEVESVTSTTVTLKNPLPYTPTSSFKVYFFRRGYLPLIASSTNIGVPLVPVDISNNMVTDGQDPSGVNVAGKGLPIEGWDLSAGGVNRQLRMRNAAPASNDVGVVVRDPESPAQTASLSVLDDWDETDRAKVNLIAGQVGVQGGSGVVTANTQRVVLATDVTPPLSAGAATEATLSSVDQNIASIIGVTDDAFNKFAVIGGRYDTSKTPLSDGNIGELCLTQYRAAKVCLFDESGNPITTLPVRAPSITWGTVTRTTVSAAATAAAANASRVALSMWNESGGQIKWTFNGTASATNYQGILNAGQGMIFEGSTNSTQALSIIAVSGTVTYTISEAT